MNKIIFLIGFICYSLTLLSQQKNKPNIIFLLSDDHQAMAMGCMGNTEIETPNMDQLAKEGILFKRCYATSPLCMASRASIMSGMYEYKTGCNFKTGALSADVWKNQSYPLLLKKSGYRIGFAGKWGFPIKDKDNKNYNASGDFDKWGALKGGKENPVVLKILSDSGKPVVFKTIIE